MSEYYDRKGEPMSQEDWLGSFGDKDQKRVAKTDVDGVSVSTVWLGLDHGFGESPPLIFETMVFGTGHPMDQEQRRYSTEADALAKHAEIVEMVRAAAVPVGERNEDE